MHAIKISNLAYYIIKEYSSIGEGIIPLKLQNRFYGLDQETKQRVADKLDYLK